MHVQSFALWIVKAVLSAMYWTLAAYLIAPMLFGDRIGNDGAILPGVPAWVGWMAVIAAVLVYAFMSRTWNCTIANRRANLERD